MQTYEDEDGSVGLFARKVTSVLRLEPSAPHKLPVCMCMHLYRRWQHVSRAGAGRSCKEAEGPDSPSAVYPPAHVRRRPGKMAHSMKEGPGGMCLCELRGSTLSGRKERSCISQPHSS